MATIVETERFLIEDDGEGWLRLERKVGEWLSLKTDELPELIDLLDRVHRK